MSTVRDSLSRLKHAVGRLEGAMRGLEVSMAGQQRDMFSAAPEAAANGLPFDSALVSRKLDKAIRKVEELLEG